MSIVWAGDPAVVDVEETLRVGQWSIVLRNGTEFANLSSGGADALRSIRFIVRDEDWRTADVLESAVERRPDGLSISGRSGYDRDAVIAWRLTASVSDTPAALRVEVEARLLRPFRRNRIGLIVLHAPELAGTALTVIHSDGAREASAFPERIAPHQPASDVAGYEWEAGEQRLSLEFAGDVFEMEDQRNWTDASYKTYSTPLAHPFPVELTTGDEIRQSLVLTRIRTHAPSGAARRPGRTDPFAIQPITDRPPTLQLGASTGPDAAVVPQDAPTTLLVEIPADEARWPAVLARAAREAAGGSLDVRIVASHAGQIEPVIAALRDIPVLRAGAFDRSTHLSEPELIAALQTTTRDSGFELVAGTRAHFTELNRNIAAFDDWDGALTFSITPQMHDRSTAQVEESLAMQRLVAENAVRLAAGRPLHLGPITLRPRFNAVATTPFAPSRRSDLTAGYGAEDTPDASDPRQHTAWAQAWWRASIAALSVPGVATLSYFEASGPRGAPRP